MKRRFLSGLLAVLMVLSIIPVMAVSVSAAAPTVSSLTLAERNATTLTFNYTSSGEGYINYCVTTKTQSFSWSGYPTLSLVSQPIIKGTSSFSVFYDNTVTTKLYLYYTVTETPETSKTSNDCELYTIPAQAVTTKISVTGVSANRKTNDVMAVDFNFYINSACTFKYTIMEIGQTKPASSDYDNTASSSMTSTAGSKSIPITLNDSKPKVIYYQATKTGDDKDIVEGTCYIKAYAAIDKVEVSRDNENTATITYTLKADSYTGKSQIKYAVSASSVSASNLVYAYNVTENVLEGSITVTGIPSTATRFYYSLYTDPGETYQTSSTVAYIAIPAYSVTKAPKITEWVIMARQNNYAQISFKSDSAGYFYYEYNNTFDDNKKPVYSGTNKSGELTMTKADTYTVTISNLTTDEYWFRFKTKGLDATSTDTEYTDKSIPSTTTASSDPTVRLESFERSTTDNTKATLKVTTNVDSIIYYRVGSTAYTDRSQIGTANKFYCTGGTIGGEITLTVPTTKTYVSLFAVNALDSTKYTDTPVSEYISNVTVDDITAPSITDLSANRVAEKQANVSFKSNEAATMYYAVSSATISDKAKLTNAVGVAVGTNSIPIALSNSSSYIISFYLKDPSANETIVTSIVVAAYVGSGTSSGYAPTINSVTRSADNDSFVNEKTGVTVTVSATANNNYVGTKTLEYTFDGGNTWSTTNKRTYTENTTIGLNQIQVRHLSDSAVQKYTAIIDIKNIDTTAPTATVTTNPTSIGSTATKVATVKVTVTAKDTQAGLSDKAYSFDGGKNWQADSFKDYTTNTNIIADTIQVRDSVGNIFTYGTTINIENIDSSVPQVKIIEATRSTEKIGNIKLNADEAGTFYYFAIYDAKDAVAEKDKVEKLKASYTMKEGENTFQVSLTDKIAAVVYYYVKDAAGNLSTLSYVNIPKFEEEDKTAPIIEKVTLSSTSPTNQPVKVTVTAKDETALDNAAYSFDNGVTWITDSFKEYKENTTIAAEYIQVRDAGGNISKYKEKVEIKNIDTEAPVVSSVTPTASGTSIVVTVTAADNVALATSAYSFDGGENWQTSPSKSYSTAQDIPANIIQVRDTAGNIYKYQQKISRETLEKLFSNVWKNPFTDVKESDWFYSYVKFAVQNGLFKGTSDTKFDPNAEMTRAMFVTVLGRLDGFETSRYTTSSFTDVKTGEWYTPYIAWAVEKGIVSGYGNNIFGLNDNISREQMCVMIVRYLNYKGISTGYTAKTIKFNDAAKINDWAREAVSICEQAGIVVGSNNNFNPAGDATRAEVATIFNRISDKYFG